MARKITKKLKREAVQILLNNPTYTEAMLKHRLAAVKSLSRSIRTVMEELLSS